MFDFVFGVVVCLAGLVAIQVYFEKDVVGKLSTVVKDLMDK